MARSPKYMPLENETPDDAVREAVQRDTFARDRRYERQHCAAFLLILFFSNLATWLFTYQSGFGSGSASLETPRTVFAGLERDTPYRWHYRHSFNSMNATESLNAWHGINMDPGVVALPSNVMDDANLPNAQPFPWEPSKGIFVLQGHHQLHCVRNIYVALMEAHYGLKPSRDLKHTLHCVDALRQGVLCNADDTPRYVPKQINTPGQGQVLQCRSWEKLDSWAKRYNACFAFVNQTTEIPHMQRFLYCPEDSPYRAAVLEEYGGMPTYEELDLEEWSYKEGFDRLFEAEEAQAGNT